MKRRQFLGFVADDRGHTRTPRGRRATGPASSIADASGGSVRP